MLVNLELNDAKVKLYNTRIDEIIEDCVTDGLDYSIYTHVNKLEDKFIPYTKASLDNFIKIENDYRKDFDGVYVCGLNSHYGIERLTDYRALRSFDSPLQFHWYGVCDNASQALDYYDSLLNKYFEYMRNKDFVILLTPIFKDHQPEYGGWRWHKWGEYIGKFVPKCEYLYDEKGIEYVYVFEIVEVEKCPTNPEE